MSSIELKNIVKKYVDGFPAVNDVSIDIADVDVGENVGAKLQEAQAEIVASTDAGTVPRRARPRSAPRPATA